MILTILYLRARAKYNLLKDQDFNYRGGILLEVLIEIAVVMSLIVISMGLN